MSIFTGLYNFVGRECKDAGHVLSVLGAFGWATSSVAQIASLSVNKKITKEEKKFLIQQEIAEGAVNTGLYFAITQLGKNIVTNLADKDKIKFPNSLDSKKINKQNIGILAVVIGSVISCNIVTPILRNVITKRYQEKARKNKIILPQEPVFKPILSSSEIKNTPNAFKPFSTFIASSGLKI